ncbi:hypothetical protein GGF50DRAFT_114398 [Schizophyllum commune]
MSTNLASFPPNSAMPDAYAISQPIADPAAVNDMLDDALCAFYAKRGIVKERPTPLVFAAEDRRATISASTRHGNGKKTTVTVHIHFHAPYPISRALGPGGQAPAVHRAQVPAARSRPARAAAVRKREVSSGRRQAYTLAGPSTSVAVPTCATGPAEDLTAPATLYAESIRSPLAMLPAFHNVVEGFERIPWDFVASTPKVKIYHGAAPLRLP